MQPSPSVSLFAADRLAGTLPGRTTVAGHAGPRATVRPHAATLAAFLYCLAGIAAPSASAQSRPAFAVIATEHDVVADGQTLATGAIQALIDRCSQRGGATVCFPAGRYLTGTIVLRDNVTLWLDAGAVLLGSRNLKDYPPHVPTIRSFTDSYTDKSLIYAERAKNIAILGRGTIDGQGAAFPGPYKVRPYMMRIIECDNVTVRDITLRSPAMWGQHYLACDNVVVDGVRVHNQANHNNDGIDVDSCHHVRIANCHINSQDDAIVLKSTTPRSCRNVVVTNCVLSSHCNAFKLGTESVGGFQNIAMSNCAVYDTGIAGVALELVDGGDFDQVSITNVAMRNIGQAAIFVRLGNRARSHWLARPGDAADAAPPLPEMGRMRNIVITNVQAAGVGRVGCSITGLPGHPVRNVTLSNVRIEFVGGGTAEDAAAQVPEKEKAYPESSMFGTLPAYGFYCRHVDNLRLHDLDLGFEKDDARPPLVFEDVRHLDVFGLRAQTGPKADCVMRLRAVRDTLIHGCRPRDSVGCMIDASGDCAHVRLTGNGFPSR